MTTTFAVTFDYLCPFARNAHEHVVEGLRGGADWDVTFRPFSLKQVHLDDDEPAVWDADPLDGPSGLLALLAGVAVRDGQPDRFPDAHLSLFAARHDDGDDIREPAVVRRALERTDVDADATFDAIAGGEPATTLAKEHTFDADEEGAFGVPTFLSAEEAVFVRLMHRPAGDVELARRTVERVLDLTVGWTDLNEFKRTRIPR